MCRPEVRPGISAGTKGQSQGAELEGAALHGHVGF